MRVDSLILEGFRNYELSSVGFDPGINVITGENAQGKTNLLEAVYMLTCGRSFRFCTEATLADGLSLTINPGPLKAILPVGTSSSQPQFTHAINSVSKDEGKCQSDTCP